MPVLLEGVAASACAATRQIMSHWLALFVLCAAIRGRFEVGGERNGSGGAQGAGGAVSRARAGAWAGSGSGLKRIDSARVCPFILGLRGGGEGEGEDEHLEQGGSQVGCQGDVAPSSSMDSLDARIASFTDSFSRYLSLHINLLCEMYVLPVRTTCLTSALLPPDSGSTRLTRRRGDLVCLLAVSYN